MAKFAAQEVGSLQEGGNQVWMCFCYKACSRYLESHVTLSYVVFHHI